MELSIYIADLLVKNNCVIIPQFGGFIANRQAAVIDRSKGQIQPPYKHLLFNPQLKNNDGLLANYVAQQIDQSYNSTLETISEKVSEWKQRLMAGERIEIAEIGFLYTSEGVVKFEQNREFNLLLEAYGLSSVKFVSLHEEKSKAVEIEFKTSEAKITTVEDKANTDEKPEPLQKPVKKPAKVLRFEDAIAAKQEVKGKEDRNVEEVPLPKTRNKWMKYAAAAVVIPALFYAYWVPMKSDFLATGNVQLSDFNPFHKHIKTLYQPRIEKTEFNSIERVISFDELTEKISDEVEIYNYQFDEELYIPVRLHSQTTTQTEVIETKPKEQIEANTGTSQSHNHYLIAGCFGNKANANTLIKDLKTKGYSAFIVDYHNGLYRVAATSSNNANELESAKSDLNNQSIATWVLKK